MITRQTRKTIEAIMDPKTEKVPRQWVINFKMMESLDFIRKDTGDHMIWRHPNGTRFILPYNRKTKDIWGFRLKDIRTLIKDIGLHEEENVVIKGEKVREKPSYEAVKDYYDTQAIAERSFQNVNKINFKEVNTTKTVTASDILEQVKKLGSMVQSVQEYLINMGTEIEQVRLDVQNAGTLTKEAVAAQKRDLQQIYDTLVDPDKAAKPQKVKMSPEDLKALRLKNFRDNQEKAVETKRNKAIAAIQKAREDFPQFANNSTKLAVLAGVTWATLKKYQKEGWV